METQLSSRWVLWVSEQSSSTVYVDSVGRAPQRILEQGSAWLPAPLGSTDSKAGLGLRGNSHGRSHLAV